MTCPICGTLPLDGEPCCTREYAKGVVRSADAKIRSLQAQLNEAQAERHDALGVLASLADCMNVANREEGLREVNNYKSLGDMRGGIDALVLHLRNRSQAEVARLRPAADALRELEEWLRGLPGRDPHLYYAGGKFHCWPFEDHVETDWHEKADTLAAAITAALAKATAAGEGAR